MNENEWYELSHMTSVEFEQARDTIEIALIPTHTTAEQNPWTNYILRC